MMMARLRAALSVLSFFLGLRPAEARLQAARTDALVAHVATPPSQQTLTKAVPDCVDNSSIALAAAAFHVNASSLQAAAVKLDSHAKAKQPLSFQSYYNQYTTGRGIWKWGNALDAYQRHFTPFAGKPVNLAEVGVQSGGSINMWHTLLGPECHVYGIDINPKVTQFQDPMTTITIGDQADVAMWQTFYASTVKGDLHILVDDGGHEANQMLVTLTQTFEHLSPDGVIAIEDIHGPDYLHSFFHPSANYLGFQAYQGKLGSVHMYPFLLIVAREQDHAISFTDPHESVDNFDAFWAAVPRNPGGHVILENAGWGPFLTAQGISNFFTHFNMLHESNWYDTPDGCEHTAAAVCTVTVMPNQMQSMVTGIHIYNNRLVADIGGGPSSLLAVRRGSEWLPYG